MALLTVAKERMFLQEENDFHYQLSKPCFSHKLLSSLQNRKIDVCISCDSQSAGARNLIRFGVSFTITTLCKDMKIPVQQNLP